MTKTKARTTGPYKGEGDIYEIEEFVDFAQNNNGNLSKTERKKERTEVIKFLEALLRTMKRGEVRDLPLFPENPSEIGRKEGMLRKVGPRKFALISLP